MVYQVQPSPLLHVITSYRLLSLKTHGVYGTGQLHKLQPSSWFVGLPEKFLPVLDLSVSNQSGPTFTE